ncbi:MAG: hypothetical protein ACW97W_15395, partial [Candidatus Hodarchaeales archaeon]
LSLLQSSIYLYPQPQHHEVLLICGYVLQSLVGLIISSQISVAKGELIIPYIFIRQTSDESINLFHLKIPEWQLPNIKVVISYYKLPKILYNRGKLTLEQYNSQRLI